MRRFMLVTAVAALLSIASAPAALAKGPVGATIEGDGIEGMLEIDQPGELGQGTPMSHFVDELGFFDLVFGESAKKYAAQPTNALGDSRLVISWDMAGETIVQELYLEADGGPVTHVAAGQKFWEGTGTTTGGWKRVDSRIAGTLVALGVDEAAVAHLVKKDSDETGSKQDETDKTAGAKGNDGTSYDKPAVVNADELVGGDKATPSGSGSSNGDTTSSGSVSSGSASGGSALSGNASSGSPGSDGAPLALILAALLALGALGAGAWFAKRRPITH